MIGSGQIQSYSLRIILLMVGSCGIAMLLIAGSLKPSPRGVGTHQQLGLPMCGILAWSGRPCPSCGMTTSWSNLMHGRFGESLRANPAGTWLGLWVLILSTWVLVSTVIGRWSLVKPNPWFFLVLLCVTLGLILAVWIFRFFF